LNLQKKATQEGTSRYKNRFSSLSLEHFREQQNWWMSSIGLGTYLGEPDTHTDERYTESVRVALESGCNLLDTAINYRFQRSERSIGRALSECFRSGKLSREEIVISTKGGFLSFDGDYPANPFQYFQTEFIERGICQAEDLVAGCHCMTPAYLENQLERSLKNLNVECIDIYFIHNPEMQLSEISRQQFLKRMLAAFRTLENQVHEERIQVYGIATWNGLRESPSSPSYISLEELIGLARDAGGEDHHFRALQLPVNLAMPEGVLKQNQMFGSTSVSVLEAASSYGMLVLASASILQGQLSRNLPEFVEQFFGSLKTDAQRAIQFVRSLRGVTTALVGMSNPAHVRENLEVAKQAPISWEKIQELFA
jgi:aryl-alcohol dehydrogenase-like predicted oxidoreductase